MEAQYQPTHKGLWFAFTRNTSTSISSPSTCLPDLTNNHLSFPSMLVINILSSAFYFNQSLISSHQIFQPFGQVPALEDGDLQLFESRAISNYIAEEYSEKGTQLVSSNSKEKAISSVWMEVEAHKFEPAAAKLSWELFYKPMFGMNTDQAVVKENEAKLEKVLDVYENRLTKSKYLGGECIGLADLYHLPNLQCLLGTTLKKLFESRPHVNAWVTDITARPAWSKVLALRG
uniref:glutathione transferase n=2 Tax=Cannabis sativa TaxID=3483 RepID=A0A803NQK7_CANSA